MNKDFIALFGNKIPRLVFIENVASSIAMYQDGGKLLCTRCNDETAVVSLMICKPDLSVGELVEYVENLRQREVISQSNALLWKDILSSPMSTFQFQRQEFLCGRCSENLFGRLTSLSKYDY